MEVLQARSELKQMTELYVERAPKRVLEIGCWDGGTLQVWIQKAQPGTQIAAIDLEHRNVTAYAGWMRDDVEVSLKVADSTSEEGLAFIRKHGPYDWMFIDGDHHLSEVESDVRVCLESAAKGALMLIHDITSRFGNENPPTAVFERLSQSYETWTYQDPTPVEWTQGIGVVQLA